MVVGIFDHADSEQQRHLGHDAGRCIGEDLGKTVHPLPVHQGCPLDLAHADDDHFDDSAFNLPTEGGVGFNAVDEDDSVGFAGHAVDMKRCSIIEFRDLDRVHRGPDRGTNKLFTDTEAFQQSLLTFGIRAPVTAHGGKNKRLRALLFQSLDNGLDRFGDIGDSPAASPDRNLHPGPDPIPDLTALHLFANGLPHIIEPAVIETLADQGHLRKSNFQTSGYRYFKIGNHRENPALVMVLESY